MTEEQIALGRRAVACKGWRWMPGMLTLSKPTVPSLRHAGSEFPYLQASEDALPDLTDAATLGCLLALVREAWGDPTLCVVLDTSDGRWCAGRWEDGLAMRGRGGASEAEALVAALEAAP